MYKTYYNGTDKIHFEFHKKSGGKLGIREFDREGRNISVEYYDDTTNVGSLLETDEVIGLIKFLGGSEQSMSNSVKKRFDDIEEELDIISGLLLKTAKILKKKDNGTYESFSNGIIDTLSKIK